MVTVGEALGGVVACGTGSSPPEATNARSKTETDRINHQRFQTGFVGFKLFSIDYPPFSCAELFNCSGVKLAECSDLGYKYIVPMRCLFLLRDGRVRLPMSLC